VQKNCYNNFNSQALLRIRNIIYKFKCALKYKLNRAKISENGKSQCKETVSITVVNSRTNRMLMIETL